MDIKFIVACCVFSFITGTYLAHMITDMLEEDRGCIVSFSSGKETHVRVGR